MERASRPDRAPAVVKPKAADFLASPDSRTGKRADAPALIGIGPTFVGLTIIWLLTAFRTGLEERWRKRHGT
jgi:hypothetical protein